MQDVYVHLYYNSRIRETNAAVSLMVPRLSGDRHCSSLYYIPFLIGFFFSTFVPCACLTRPSAAGVTGNPE